MKRKIIIFLSFWPTTYLIVFLATTFAVFLNLGNVPQWLSVTYKIVNYLWHPTFWLFFGTIIFYLIQIFKTKIVEEEKRLDWGAAIFFLGLISFPIFWFKYMKDK